MLIQLASNSEKSVNKALRFTLKKKPQMIFHICVNMYFMQQICLEKYWTCLKTSLKGLQRNQSINYFIHNQHDHQIKISI